MSYTLADSLSACGFTPKSAHKRVQLLQHIPRKSQVDILGLALRTKRFGDFSDPGTGKSLISYLYLTALLMGGRKAIAIMPPGLTEQYLENYYKAIDVEVAGISTIIINQTPAKRRKLYTGWDTDGWPDLLIIGYQTFLQDGGTFLMGKGYNTFVADEAHMLKSAKAKTHKLFKLFVNEDKNNRVLLMTGTPMPTTPECAYGVISILTPQTYWSKAAFDRQHLVKIRNPMSGFNMVVGYKNLDKLSNNLYLQAKRVIKEDVLDIKKPNIIPVEVKMSMSHAALYKKLVEERVLEVEGEFIPAIHSQTLRRYATQVASAPHCYTDNPVTSNTLPTLDALLDSLGVVKYKEPKIKGGTSQLNKVVLFAWFSDTIEMLTNHLKDLNPAIIDGSHNTRKNAKKFIEDISCRAAIIQPRSGGVGLEGFQKVCSNVIFFEPVTSPGEFDQATSRVLRSGQDKVVNVYIFNVLGTVFSKDIRTMLGRTEDLKTVVVSLGELMQELLGGAERIDK